jgi:hypothetical protein
MPGWINNLSVHTERVLESLYGGYICTYVCDLTAVSRNTYYLIKSSTCMMTTNPRIEYVTCARTKKKEKHETRKQRSNRRVPVALNHIHIISSLFFFFFFSKCHIRIYLHVNPPRHPKLRNLLRLVHKPHVQEQLRGASDGTLQRAEDPRVRVGGVFAHCRFRKKVSNARYKK